MTAPADAGVVLETDRLTLRRFTDTDADGGLLFELDSDPEVMRYVGPFALGSVAAYREKIRTRYLPGYAAHPARGVFAAEGRATGEFLGWFALRPATDYLFAKEAGWTRDTDLEIGYRLRRAAWGKGYATEGALALVRLALADPAVTCVVACAMATNRASCRVLEKCGLTRVREFPLPGFADPDVSFALCRAGCEPPGA